MTPKEYMMLLEESGAVPNFWCSEDYLTLSLDTQIVEYDSFVGISCTGLESTWLLPLMHKVQKRPIIVSEYAVWSDFGDMDYPAWNSLLCAHHLDYEYIYDPQRFLDLSGGDFASFRKNITKPVRGRELQYGIPMSGWQAVRIYAEWRESHEDEVQDEDTILQYLIRSRHVEGAVDVEAGKFVGLNVWDENYRYINFRYSFCTPSIPHLSEWMRYQFFINRAREAEASGVYKLVNDGGSLDSESLRKFKLKLQPVSTRVVYSWEPRRTNED